MSQKKLYIALLLSSILFILSAEEINPVFKRITVSDGLSQNTINSIIQDKYGFMWFGTQDGLNRFDGYEFKVYRNEQGNTNSISNNFIWKTLEDSEGNIWIGTFGGGLNKFNPVRELFIQYNSNSEEGKSLSNDNVFEIVESSPGIIWVGTNNGLNKVNVESGKVIQYEKLENSTEKGEPTNLVNNIAVMKKNNVWFNSKKGLSCLELQSEKISHFQKDPFNEEIEFGKIDDLVAIEEKLYVLCTSGLVELNTVDSTTRVIINQDRMMKFAGSDFIPTEVYFDSDSVVFVGTTNGLFLYNFLTDKLNYFKNETANQNSLVHNSILSLYKSAGNVYWIGTQSGLMKVERLKKEFRLIKRNPGEKYTLTGNNVGPIIEDRFGYAWIGTRGGEAINIFDEKTGRIKVLKNEPGNLNSISGDYILSFLEDSKGNIWIGTRGSGLNKIRNTGTWSDKINVERINPIALPGENPSIVRVQTIMEDRNGLIWLGTGGGGLCSYNYETNKIKSYPYSLDGSGPSHTFVYALLEDSYGNFWVGTATGGINLMDRRTGKFLYFTNNAADPASLSNNLILDIFESKVGDIWLGTAGGLNKLLTQNKEDLFGILSSGSKLEFKSFGNADGFPNEVIYGILEDGDGFLWISTNKGIVKFDPVNEKVISTYDVTDGLQNNEFNQKSFFKNKDGLMYFGGLSGLNIFDPAKITGNTYIPPVVITDFKLFNKSVSVNSTSANDDFALDKNIFALNSIDLSYTHKVFSFEFSSLNYISSAKNEYAYKMEGFDKDWIYAGTERSITYTNLDPGEYTFRVKGSNNKGLWNENGTYLKISIEPPPWKTWWAYSIYGLLFLTGIILLIKFREWELKREIEVARKIEEAKSEERVKVRTKTSQDFHDEAGNKLTKINLFTSLAKKEAEDNPILKEYLGKIQENTKELSNGMRDFLWVLDAGKDSLYDMLKRIEDFGNSMFELTETRFKVKGIDEKFKQLILPMEVRRSLILIFKEAINNSLKYSDAEDVSIAISLENGYLEISLTDNGCGFELNEYSEGYGLNNMKARAEKLNGTLDITSLKSHGTKIKFRCNITHMGN